MNVERTRTLFKKILPYALAVFTLGAGGTAVASQLSASDCCQPGAECCYPGSPCCEHGEGPAAPGAEH